MHQSMCECSRNLKYSLIFILQNKHSVPYALKCEYLHEWNGAFCLQTSCSRLTISTAAILCSEELLPVQNVPAVWVRL